MPTDGGGERQRLITREFLVVTGATLAFFTYVGVLVPLLPTLVERGLGGSKFDIGLMMASFSVAAIACRPLLAAVGERVGMRMLMVSGAVIAATIAAERPSWIPPAIRICNLAISALGRETFVSMSSICSQSTKLERGPT